MQRLQAELEETKSAIQGERAVRKALEEEIHKLCNDLNQRTKEKEGALARVQSQSQLDNFNVRQFLNGTLEGLPPMPNPVVVAADGRLLARGVTIESRREKRILYVNGENAIKWANKGGGCVIPFPPAIYNGSTNVAEPQASKETIEDRSFELFGVDGHCIYYGTYRCIKVATMDWKALKLVGHEFASAFLEATIVRDGHAAPVTRSFVENMYMTGILKPTCAVLRCEGFDDVIMKDVQSASRLPRGGNALIHNVGKRPKHNGKGSQGPSKKPRLMGGEARTQRAHRTARIMRKTKE